MLAVRDEAPRRERAKQRRTEQSIFGRVRRAEMQYSRQLRAIARNCGMLAGHYDPDRPETAHWLVGALRQYAGAVREWATASGARMLVEVEHRDAAAWARHSRNMSESLQREIRQAPTAELLRVLLAEQVDLITSI